MINEDAAIFAVLNGFCSVKVGLVHYVPVEVAVNVRGTRLIKFRDLKRFGCPGNMGSAP